MPGKIVVAAERQERIGTLFLPPDSMKSPVMGTIIAICGDEEGGDEYYPLAVGDVVLFNRNSGVKVTVGREEYLFFRVAEILARVTWEEQDE